MDRRIHRSQAMRRRGRRPRHRQLEIPQMGSIVFAGGGEDLFIFVVNEMTILLLTIDAIRVEGRHCSLSLSLKKQVKNKKDIYWVFFFFSFFFFNFLGLCSLI